MQTTWLMSSTYKWVNIAVMFLRHFAVMELLFLLSLDPYHDLMTIAQDLAAATALKNS